MKAHKYLLTDKRKSAVGPTESSPDDCWSVQSFIQQLQSENVERHHVTTKGHGPTGDFVITWRASETTKPQGHHKDFCHSFRSQEQNMNLFEAAQG